MSTLRDEFYNIFGYGVDDAEGGWDRAIEGMRKSGYWSIAGSPKKFEALILELIKRVEQLERYDKSRENKTTV